MIISLYIGIKEQSHKEKTAIPRENASKESSPIVSLSLPPENCLSSVYLRQFCRSTMRQYVHKNGNISYEQTSEQARFCAG